MPDNESESLRYRIQRLGALEDCKRVSAALRVAVDTLAHYADRDRWHPGYENEADAAREAIQKIEKELEI